MKKIELYVYPYWHHAYGTEMVVDQQYMNHKESRLYPFVIQKKMKDWLNPYTNGFHKWQGILPELIREYNDDTFLLTFYGRKRDYEGFCKGIQKQQESLKRKGIETKVDLLFQEQWEVDRTLPLVQELIQSFIAVIVQRLDGDGYEDIKGLKDTFLKVPVSFDENCPEPFQDSLGTQKIIQSPKGIHFVTMDQSKTVTQVMAEIQVLMDRTPDANGFFLFICLLSEGLNTSNENCEYIRGHLPSQYQEHLQLVVVRDISQCEELFLEYLRETYFPVKISEAIRTLFNTATRLNPIYEDAYLIDLLNEIDSLTAITKTHKNKGGNCDE